jgi:predicted nuclease of predicted toxin-antitoxin system
MRFLVDMPVSPGVVTWLVGEGHDAVHAADVGLGTASDREVLDRAAAERRIVVTADTDFPQLLALSRARTPGVILLRGGGYSANEMSELLQRVLDASSEDALAASICVVDRRQVRYRRLPIP